MSKLIIDVQYQRGTWYVDARTLIRKYTMGEGATAEVAKQDFMEKNKLTSLEGITVIEDAIL